MAFFTLLISQFNQSMKNVCIYILHNYLFTNITWAKESVNFKLLEIKVSKMLHCRCSTLHETFASQVMELDSVCPGNIWKYFP